MRVFWICVRPRSIGSQAAGCPCANGFGVRPWCRGSVRGARFVERLSERGAKSIKLLPNKKGRRVPPRMTSSLGLSSSLGFFFPPRTAFLDLSDLFHLSGFLHLCLRLPGLFCIVPGFSTSRRRLFDSSGFGLSGSSRFPFFWASSHRDFRLSGFLDFWLRVCGPQAWRLLFRGFCHARRCVVQPSPKVGLALRFVVENV